jgi:hypothetical protein
MVNFHLLATENAISIDFAPVSCTIAKASVPSRNSRYYRRPGACRDLALSLGQIANVPDRSLAALATAQALARDAARIRRMSTVEGTAGGSDRVAFLPGRMHAGDVPELFMIGKAVDAGGWFGVYHSNWLVQRLVHWPGIVTADSSQLVLIPVTAQGRRMVRYAPLFGSLRSIAFV